MKCELDNFIDSSHSTCTMFFKDVETTQEVGPVRGGTELWPIKIDNNNNNNNLNENDLSIKTGTTTTKTIMDWIFTCLM